MPPSWNDWMHPNDLSIFKSVGVNVKVSRNAIIFGAANIEIGDNVRIDAGCILQASEGFIKLGSHIHLAAGSIFQAGGGITFGDHSQVAAGVRMVSASDDLGGFSLIGPCAPTEKRQVWKGPIQIGRLCVVGINSVVLPAVEMKTGSILGANSMAKAHQVLDSGWIYYGSPAEKRKARLPDYLQLAEDFEYAYEAAKNGR